jgi:hypothetical protein
MTDAETVRAYRDAVLRMAKADYDYGCGFYGEKKWLDAYFELTKLAGLPDDWRETWRKIDVVFPTT